MKDTKPKKTIGRVELVSLPMIGINPTHARIDTGAKTTAIWASKIEEKDNKLEVVFLGKKHPQFTGIPHTFKSYKQKMVASSNGQSELRYEIKTRIDIGGKRIRARLTLADRSTQAYPILVGRNVLRGKFIVDVQLGNPDIELEKSKSEEIQSKLKENY